MIMMEIFRFSLLPVIWNLNFWNYYVSQTDWVSVAIMNTVTLLSSYDSAENEAKHTTDGS
jgi:hypothetical protein